MDRDLGGEVLVRHLTQDERRLDHELLTLLYPGEEQRDARPG